MNNVKDLRDELINSFGELKSGEMTPKKAKEITNMAGKIILSAKVELDYNKFLKQERVIDFLNVENSGTVTVTGVPENIIENQN